MLRLNEIINLDGPEDSIELLIDSNNNDFPPLSTNEKKNKSKQAQPPSPPPSLPSLPPPSLPPHTQTTFALSSSSSGSGSGSGIRETTKQSRVSQAAILCLYLIEGITLTLPDIAQRLFMNNILFFTPSEIQLVYGIMLLPWLLKPLFALFSDSFPLFGYRRSPYIFTFYFFCFLSWFALALMAIYITINEGNVMEEVMKVCRVITILSFTASSFSLSFAGVVTDSFVVELVHQFELPSSSSSPSLSSPSSPSSSDLSFDVPPLLSSSDLLMNTNHDNDNDDNNINIDVPPSNCNIHNNNDNNIDNNNNNEEESNKRCGTKEENKINTNVGDNFDDKGKGKEEGGKEVGEGEGEGEEEKKRKGKVGRLQSYCCIFRIVGTLIASFCSGYLLNFIDQSMMFLLTSLFPLFACFFVLFIKEQKMPFLSSFLSSPFSSSPSSPDNNNNSNNNNNVHINDENDENDIPMIDMSGSRGEEREEGYEEGYVYEKRSPSCINHRAVFTSSNANNQWLTRLLIQCFSIKLALFGPKQLWKPALFILLISSSPSSFSAFFFYLADEVKLNDSQFGFLSLSTNLASLLGTILYRMFLLPTNIRKIFAITIVLATLVRCSQLVLIFGLNQSLGIPDVFFAIGDRGGSSVIAVTSQIALMPLIILGASVSPPGIEGSIYAILMSMTSFGGIIGDFLGTLLTSILHVTESDFSNLWLLTLLCNLFSIFPLFFIWLVPNNIS